MAYDPFDDTAQPICPACGVTMHPLLDEGVSADECRECGFQLEWSGTDADASGEAERYREGWG